MELKGKTVVVLVADNFQEMELWYPVYRLQEAGAKVLIVGAQAETTYKSKLGYPAKSDVAIDNIKVDDIDAVIIPGGFAPDSMRTNEHMVALVRDTFKQGKIVAAICHAGWMLVSADIIKGKQVTGYRAIKDDLVNAGGQYLDQSVVQDGNIITSRTPHDLPDFCRAIVTSL